MTLVDELFSLLGFICFIFVCQKKRGWIKYIIRRTEEMYPTLSTLRSHKHKRQLAAGLDLCNVLLESSLLIF